MGRRGGDVLHDAAAAVFRQAHRVPAIAAADSPRAARRRRRRRCARCYGPFAQPRVAAATRTWLPLALIAIVTIGGHLRAVLPRAWRPAGAARCACCAHVRATCISRRIAFALALAGYALVVWRSFWRAPALILAVTTLSRFLLLQDEDLARAFLAGAPVSSRRSCRARSSSLAAAMFAPLWMLPRDASGCASGIHRHRLDRSRHCSCAHLVSILDRVAADSRRTSSMRRASRSSSASRPIRRQRSRDRRAAGRVGSAHAGAAAVVYLGAQRARPRTTRARTSALFASSSRGRDERYENVYFIGEAAAPICYRRASDPSLWQRERFRVPEFEKTAYDVYPRAASRSRSTSRSIASCRRQ